ncbi:hypothetical protein AALC25_10215 [Lachnospiraceae bacterium 29-84]
MGTKIEWVKTAVQLCMASFETENEKRRQFIELESQYYAYSPQIQREIMVLMKEGFEINDLIYVFSVLIRYTEGKEFRRNLMDCLIMSDFDCDTRAMLEYQAMSFVVGEYKRKRIFRRKNIEKFSQKLSEMEYPFLPPQKRNKKRIVIIAGQIVNLRHAPTKMILNIAYTLQEYLGYEVFFYICPCDCWEVDQALWYGLLDEITIDHFRDKMAAIAYQDTVFKGFQINMGELRWKEYGMMLSFIHAWNPLFVLNCGTINPIVELIGTYTTLVSMRMSVECPISEGEILIRLGKEDDATEKGYEDMLGKNQVQLFMKEKFPVIDESGVKSFTRQQLNLPDGQFLITIVGNSLQKEITKSFVLEMKRILETIPNASFVIIGKSDGITEYFTDGIFKERIFYLGYCDHLVGVYGALDLYLNLDRKGGGFSSAMALIAEIPVVTLPDCDVAYNCGEAFIVRDYDDMFHTVCRYAMEPEFYEAKRRCAQAYKEQNTQKKLNCFVTEMLDGIIGIIEQHKEQE